MVELLTELVGSDVSCSEYSARTVPGPDGEAGYVCACIIDRVQRHDVQYFHPTELLLTSSEGFCILHSARMTY
jgi:hypothetical protein